MNRVSLTTTQWWTGQLASTIGTRVLIFATCIVITLLLWPATTRADADPPAPQPEKQTGIPWLDAIYYGATPQDSSQGPVLVFVHGYGGVASDWWSETPLGELNDMYSAAYAAGYRTAFVSLGGDDGLESKSMWDNGRRLKRQLQAITQRYGVDKVDIVAHSKGGIDAQAAVAHYDGWQLVRRVFTLGSPHRGSELADLLYSQWASRLAELLGLHNEATSTLQTGYMQFFRSVTDPKVEQQDVRYYRGAGTDTGPQFSGLWFSGLYLSTFGENDGAVTVASTESPHAETLFVQPYHHYSIFMGNTVLAWLDAVIRDVGTNRQQRFLPTIAYKGTTYSPEPPPQQQFILRGGLVRETVTQTVPIESNAVRVTFDLMVPNDGVTATLTGPDGKERALHVIPPTGEHFFERAWQLVREEESPQAGDWTFVIRSPQPAAYFLLTVVESPVEVALQGWPNSLMAPGDTLQLQVSVRHPDRGATLQQIEAQAVSAAARSAGPANGVEISRVMTQSCREGEATALCATLPPQEGVYNVSVTVTGTLPDGTSFERSFVRSVAVASPDTINRTWPLDHQSEPIQTYPPEVVLMK